MDFDADLCAKYCEMLVAHDETERALLVLDNVPAFYRDNHPAVLSELRSAIHGARFTTHTYMHHDGDVPNEAPPVAVMSGLLRGRLIRAEVERYNAAGKIPHIIDVGPGSYFVPLALKELGLKFTYCDVSLNLSAKLAVSELPRQKSCPPGEPLIFLALEVIEHIPDPSDLLTECLRHTGGVMPDRVHLSTPLYTYDNKHDDWRKTGLPHLRAYTPNEFLQISSRLFQGYGWHFHADPVMSVRGMRRDVIDAEPLEKGK